MKIGIDFDNTISNYEKILYKLAIKKKIIKPEVTNFNKLIIKKNILNKTKSIEEWKKIQSQIYGKYMLEAKLFEGFAKFILLCNYKKIEVFIVSHKTKYPHYNFDKIDLRNQAVLWMKKNNFFKTNFLNLKIENIFFESSLNKKINTIKKIQCNYFIDDLEKVFNHKKFPNKTKKILFSNYKNKDISNYKTYNWDDICNYFFNTKNIFIGRALFEKIQNHKNYSIKKIQSRANSQVYKISLNKKKYLLKIYPNKDNRKRLFIEYNALNFLRTNRFKNIPTPIIKNTFFNVALYEYLEGNSISRPSKSNIRSALLFIKKLRDLYNRNHKDFNHKASEACFNYNSLIFQIEGKLKSLNELKFQKKTNLFIINKLTPLWNKLKKDSFLNWPQNNLINNLNKNNLTFSPSDFGFHNSLIKKNKVQFIDFEYFGYDDPVKIISDFLWHPSMNISLSNKNYWQINMFKIFKSDINITQRFKSAYPLYGFRWILIMLKYISFENTNKSNLLSKQIVKNQNYNKILDYYKIINNYDINSSLNDT